MTPDELTERVAIAMYGSIAHVYSWDLCREDHRDMWRRQARAALTELIAIVNLRNVFPDMERVQ
jgi:hypothetical protein